MKFNSYLKKEDKTFVTFEVLPPVKGSSIQPLFDILEPLMEFEPPFINITYHGPEEHYKAHPNGYYEKIKTRKRPGTVAIAAAIRHKLKVEPIPHLTVRGLSKERLEDMLIDLNYLDVNNVLVIRGDPAKMEGRFKAHPRGHSQAIDLVRQIRNMNQGIYLDETLKYHEATDFCVGVAGYPEKHAEAPNMETDLQHLKQKVDAGADYIVTQLFYDNAVYYKFVENCRAHGIDIPIIPGLKPITRKSHLSLMPDVFNASIPQDLAREVRNANDKEAVLEIGKEWTIAQSRDLVKNKVPLLHYYTMSRIDPVADIVKAVF